MMQLHLTANEAQLIQAAGYSASMPASHIGGKLLNEKPWTWQAKYKKIFNRDIWLFIERDSQFCLCFFGLQPRQLRQLDLTLWLRLISEYKFISGLQENVPASLTDEFLPVVRSWMAPMGLEEDHFGLNQRADSIFQSIETFLRRPLPLDLNVQVEMEFSWFINTVMQPEKKPAEPDVPVENEELRILKNLGKNQQEITEFPAEKYNLSDVDDIEIMSIIHQQIKANTLNLLSPAALFSTRIAHMVATGKEETGQLLQFQPRER